MAASACSPPGTVFPPPRPPIADSIGAGTLLARLEQREEEIRTLRGLATMRYESPTERVQVQEVVVVERPDRLRLEMISTFGLALQIASDGTRLRAFHRADRTFYEGEATTRNLGRFTRVALRLDEITDVLVGLPPVRDRTHLGDPVWEPETGLWRLAVPLGAKGRQILWFEGESLLPARTEEVDAAGVRRYLIAFRDYREVAGVLLAHEILLEIPSEEARITMAYSEMSLNRPVEETLFTFEPPAGARVVSLDGHASSLAPAARIPPGA